MGKLIVQASYYYMGHFSRFIPPGSRRISLQNTVEIKEPDLSANDVKNGQALLFAPCDGNEVQSWLYDDTQSLISRGTDEAEGSDGFQHGGECIDVDSASGVKTQVWACAHSGNQQWVLRAAPGGSQLYNPANDKCMTAVSTSGIAVGLDAGVTIVAAQMKDCEALGTKSQTFIMANYDQGGFPSNFPIRTQEGELCLQPQIQRLPHFDAVAFEQPDGQISLIAMNMGDVTVDFSIVDSASSAGLDGLTLTPHSIHSYRWKPKKTEPTPSLASVLTTASQAVEKIGDGTPHTSIRTIAWCSAAAAAAAALFLARLKIRRAKQHDAQGTFEPAVDNTYVEFQEVATTECPPNVM